MVPTPLLVRKKEDWRDNISFRFSSQEGVYKSFFQIDEIDPHATYLIDLGKVYFTAEVMINDKPVGHRIYAPYSIDITNYLKKRKNSIDVKVTPGQLNGFIGEAAHGNKLYNAYKGKQNDLTSAGLIGPVNILKQ